MADHRPLRSGSPAWQLRSNLSCRLYFNRSRQVKINSKPSISGVPFTGLCQRKTLSAAAWVHFWRLSGDFGTRNMRKKERCRTLYRPIPACGLCYRLANRTVCSTPYMHYAYLWCTYYTCICIVFRTSSSLWVSTLDFRFSSEWLQRKHARTETRTTALLQVIKFK